MAKKGQPKNTRNKALHSKLMGQKKNKLREKKLAHEFRLKELTRKMNEQKKKDEEGS